MKQSSRVRSYVAFTVVVVAVVLVVFTLLVPDRDSGSPAQRGRNPVDVAATDAISAGSVADLAAASACVVEARVAAVARGRVVGDGDGAVVSKLVELAPRRTVAGDCPDHLVVEEEGWLPDGAPVRVNGWPGSEPGDLGVWFLVGPVEDDRYVTVASTGAIRFRAGRPLVPATAPDWIRAVATDGIGAVVTAAAAR